MWQRAVPKNVVTIGPQVEPVSVDEVKLNLQLVDSDDDNTFIREQLIPEARATVERLACRSLITQTRAQYYDHCMPCEIFVRYSPVQSVSSIVYQDENNATQTLSSSLYTVDTKPMPARIVEAYNQHWPGTADVLNAVTVTCVCGFGSSPSQVPIIYRRAIIYLATHWFWNRDQLGCVDGSMWDRLGCILGLEGMTVEYA